MGESWWGDDEPKNLPAGGGIAESVKALYQKYLGRAPENDDVVNSWIQGTGGNLAAIEQGISGSNEALHRSIQPIATTGTASPTGGGTDTRGALEKIFAQYGLDPNNPGHGLANIDYFAGGGGGHANPGDTDYWTKRTEQEIRKALYGEQGDLIDTGGGGSALSGMSGYRPMASYQPPQAPQYTPYQVTPLKTPDPYKLPTAEEARATPGYQFALEQGTEATKRANVASGNAGGATLKELAQYGTGLADQTYQNTVANSMNAYNTNTGNELNFWGANTNAGLSAAGLNLQGVNQQFQNTYQPSFAAYQSDVAQNQFGANYGLNLGQLGLSAQNQFWNQGFNENQNAFNQYTKQQNDAFDQWYKQAQLGYVGNPYS